MPILVTARTAAFIPEAHEQVRNTISDADSQQHNLCKYVTDMWTFVVIINHYVFIVRHLETFSFGAFRLSTNLNFIDKYSQKPNGDVLAQPTKNLD